MKFHEYYEYYLTLHQNKWCRRLHVLGQLATVAFIGVVVYKKIWLLLLLAPFIVYPFAWSGHFFFEKNMPAAFSNPLWSKACDWLMLRDIIIGRIKA
ncbi:hypothetical protein CL634_00635 [bacterium]|nr:hypothetical protein [bacterium]|tara:strand:- start:364 stop:654 length:291 start_codon:yes stop_codon:yes gene_type:complete